MLPCNVCTSRTSSGVAANLMKLLQSSIKVVIKVGVYSERSYVHRLCVAKELYALSTGAYVALGVKKIQLVLWRV